MKALLIAAFLVAGVTSANAYSDEYNACNGDIQCQGAINKRAHDERDRAYEADVQQREMERQQSRQEQRLHELEQRQRILEEDIANDSFNRSLNPNCDTSVFGC